jgi:hypothetical protein
MNVRYYLTVSKTDLVVEDKYFWYYPNGYTCVDARYVNINTNNGYALFELENFFYKLMYLNDNVSQGFLVDEGVRVLNKYKKTRGVFISEEDVFNIAQRCFNKEFSNEILDRIYSHKKFMWKSSVSELYVMTDEEKKVYNELSGYKKESYLINFKSKKKQKEVITFLNKIKGMSKKKKVIEVIELLKIGYGRNEKVPIKEVVDNTGFAFKTVAKYYEEYVSNDIGVEGYKLVVNRNEINKQEKINEIQSIINQMKLNGEKINKKSVADRGGFSRTTITKHWDKLKI